MSSLHYRTTGLILLLLAMALPALCQGKGHGVEVRQPAEAEFSVRASEIITTTLRVTNLTDVEQELVEVLTAPEGWQSVLPLPGFRLAPQAGETRLVAFRVPPGAAGGSYDVTYEVHSRRDPAVRDAQTLRVTVARQSQLSLQVDNPPARMVANSAISLTLRVANDGNVPLQVSLTAAAPVGLTVALEPNALSLPPRASADVTMTVQAGETKSKALRLVTVTASGVGEAGADARATRTLPLTVLPRSASVPSLAHTLPVELAVSAVGDGNGAALQFELSGHGTLDEAGERQLDFCLRGPDVSDRGFFGTRDEYVLDYHSPRLDVGVGDRLFGLSELTDQSLYGRGLAIDSKLGPDTAFGLWTMRSRWDRPATTAIGAFASHELSDRASLRLNWLQRQGQADDPAASDRFWSLQANLTPLPRTTLDLEYGLSRSADAGADQAWRVHAVGHVGEVLDWSLLHVTAGPEYRGYYRDCAYTTGTLAAKLNRRLQLRYAYTRWLANLDHQPDQAASPDETLHRVSLQMALARQWGLTLGLDELSFRDAAAPERTDYDSRRLWTALAYSQSHASLRLEVRQEERDDHAADCRERAVDGRLYASYAPSHKLSLTAYGGWGDRRRSGESDPLTASADLGFAAMWEPRPNLHVRAWLGQYQSEGLGASCATQSGLTVEHRDGSGRKVALEVRSTDGTGAQRDTAYLLTYALPFELPVGRKHSVGVVSGQILDESAAPVADVVVSLDDAVTVSDARGRFAFGEVTPGRHVLSVDGGTLGQRLLDQDPDPVYVTGGQAARVDLRLVAAAAVTGVVAIAAPVAAADGAVVGDPARAQIAAGTGVPNLIVELTRDGEKPRRQSTDGQGRFNFESLRPGTWHLKIYPTNLPPLHRLVQPEQDLVVPGGEGRQVAVQVLPMARQMRMLRSDVVPVTPAPAPAGAN